MNFPMRVDFSLGRLKNSTNPTSYPEMLELYNSINSKVLHRVSTSSVTSLNKVVNIDSIESIELIESSLLENSYSELIVNFPQEINKKRYYLVVDSNASFLKIKTSKNELGSNGSTYNRTIYVFHPISSDTIVVTNILKDMYQTEESEFETEDFVGWDLNIG